MPSPFIGSAAMPQANIASLTEEQLRQLESDERQGLECRIQWLRDIQTLLDSAVEQMNQYTLVCLLSLYSLFSLSSASY